MKDAYINAKILDPEKNKEFIGDIIVEKNKIIDVGPRVAITIISIISFMICVGLISSKFI